MADIVMPQLGESVTEGTITKWFKQVGDHVAEDETLFERVRKLAEPALANGFAEISTNVNAVTDPADPERTLDTFYEVFLAHEVATLEDAVPVLKFALGLEKAVAAHVAHT